MALDVQVARDDEESIPKVDSETHDVIIVGAGAAGIGV